MISSRVLFVTLVLVTVSGGPRAWAQSVSAFTNVTVVPMDRERVLRDRTVIVRDGRIAEIGPASSVEIPEAAQRIDGRGRYLMPGLTDMHVHLATGRDLLLYVANGVTTIRVMSGRPRILAWRDSITRGELLGPTVYTTGPIIDGSPPTWPNSSIVDAAEEAEPVVLEQREAGYDFMKVYGGLSKEAYLALLEAGKRHGLRAVGHVSRSVGIETALSVGQESIEHLSGYREAIRPVEPPVELDWDGFASEEVTARIQEIGTLLLAGEASVDDFMDEQKLAQVATATRSADVWNVPTLVVFHRTALAGREWEAALAEPEMAYVWPRLLQAWGSSDDFRRDEPTEQRKSFLKAWREREFRMVRALHRAGARILLGTDATNPYVVAGYSVHLELGYLVRSGLTPFEAIHAGTASAAEFLGSLDDFGTVSVGKRADLILLEADPLKDVSNVARRVGVMIRGRWLPEAELERRLAELAASDSSASTAR